MFRRNKTNKSFLLTQTTKPILFTQAFFNEANLLLLSLLAGLAFGLLNRLLCLRRSDQKLQKQKNYQ